MSSTRIQRVDRDGPDRVRYESPTSSYVKWSALKKRVSFRDILEHYEVLRYMDEKQDSSLSGPCPIHKDGLAEDVDYHERRKSGSFKVTATLKGFKCFGCDARGSIIDFVAAKEGCSPTHAGRLINEWFPQAGTGSSEAKESSPIGPNPDVVVKNPKGTQLADLKDVARKYGQDNGLVAVIYVYQHG